MQRSITPKLLIMTPLHPHSRRFLALVVALLLIMASELRNPLRSTITHHSDLLLVLRTAECTLCDDLRDYVMVADAPGIAFREYVSDDEGIRRAIVELNRHYAAALPRDSGLPIYARFIDGAFLGAGWGLDNADGLIGFLPNRVPVAVGDTLRLPRDAVYCSAHANGSRCVFG